MHHITTQLRFELEKFNAQKGSITSLFIGGGTPSTIPASWYEPFFEMIAPYLSHDAEVTSEANPHSATKEWIEGINALGVNRLSFGVQSFNAEKLIFLGRNHTPKIALEAIEHASKLGIQNISLDLIYGTSMDTPSLLQEDLNIASSLPINHLSAYALTLEEDTPFYKRTDVVNGSEKLAKAFVKAIIEAGFAQYEISNFGTYQSSHNKGYWEHQDYIGIGAGAVGFLKEKRFYPSKEIEAYIQNPLAQEIEALNLEDLHVEKLFLGLRSTIGVSLEELSEKEMKRINILVEENKLTCKENRLFNNDYFLSDEIALFITQ